MKNSEKIDKIMVDVAVIKTTVTDMKPKVDKNTAYRQKSAGIILFVMVATPLALRYLGMV